MRGIYFDYHPFMSVYNIDVVDLIVSIKEVVDVQEVKDVGTKDIDICT